MDHNSTKPNTRPAADEPRDSRESSIELYDENSAEIFSAFQEFPVPAATPKAPVTSKRQRTEPGEEEWDTAPEMPFSIVAGHHGGVISDMRTGD